MLYPSLCSKHWLLGLAAAGLVAASCSKDDAASGPCDGNMLENTVSASSWATKLAQIASYRYAADLEAGVTTVGLLGASGQVLDTLKVWQSYGDEKVPEGAMVAELGGLRLVTRGFDVAARGYLVRATLSGDGKPTLITSARFESVALLPEAGRRQRRAALCRRPAARWCSLHPAELRHPHRRLRPGRRPGSAEPTRLRGCSS